MNMAAVCHSKHVSGCENNNTDLSLVFNIYFIRIIFHGLTTPARCSSGWIVETLQGGNGTVAISSAASSTTYKTDTDPDLDCLDGREIQDRVRTGIVLS